MSVYDNLAFGLKLRKVPKPDIDRRVKEAAETIQLTTLLQRKPKELSGGQRQRVALGRAIVREPAVFLMDEPLSNLDAKLRVQTRAEIARLHQRLKTTIVYVTHDQVEAMTMGQRIAVMSQAKLQQVGSPKELYDHPINQFVAGFIGSPAMNFLAAELTGSGESAALTVAGITFPLPAHYREGVGATSSRKFVLGIRPEHMDVAPGGSPTVDVRTTADVVEYLGNEVLLHTIVSGVDIVAVVDAEHRVRPGDVINLHIPLDKFHLFDTETTLAVPRPRFDDAAAAAAS
jgi:multiple sugar transport system ATP-binding protein